MYSVYLSAGPEDEEGQVKLHADLQDSPDPHGNLRREMGLSMTSRNPQDRQQQEKGRGDKTQPKSRTQGQCKPKRMGLQENSREGGSARQLKQMKCRSK